MSDEPSLHQWKTLYQAALEFKNLECWNWMWDSDIFGVQNPETGEIGYCCVMGMLGEYYALAVYLGTEGLEGLLRIQSGEEFLPSESLHVQKCLIASFEDREFLQKEDLNVIKKLGLTLREHNLWPLFRSYLPGYFPWFFTSDEAQYVTEALQQTIDVCSRVKDDAELLIGPTEDHYLVRVFQKEKNTWVDEWVVPPPVEEPEPVVVPVDESRLEKIKKMTKRQETWEIDFFYSPQGIREKDERPYFPYVILWIDHDSGFILNIHLAERTEYASECVEQFLNLLEKTTFIPEEILVKKEELFSILAPVTSHLGITLKKVRTLPMVEEAQADMAEFFRGEKKN